MIIHSSNERSCKVILKLKGHKKMLEINCSEPGAVVTVTPLGQTVDYGEGLGVLLDLKLNKILRDSDGCVIVFNHPEYDYHHLSKHFGSTQFPPEFTASELDGLEEWLSNSKDLLKWSRCHPNDTVEGPDEVGMTFSMLLYRMALDEKVKKS